MKHIWAFMAGLVQVIGLSPVQRIFSDESVEVHFGPSLQSEESQLKMPHGFTDMTIKFDDIPTSTPFSNITTYSKFNFTSYQLLNTSLAANSGTISPEDEDCATSSPNALYGNRTVGTTTPFISVACPPGTKCDEEFHSTFQIHTFSIKPIGYKPKLLRIFLRGWEIKHGNVINVYGGSVLYFEDGFQEPIKDFEVWKYWGKISLFEIYAETWEGEDWAFCVDDLVVSLSD